MSVSPTVPDTCPSGDALSALITPITPTGESTTVDTAGVSPTVRWTHRDRRSREHLRPAEVEALLSAAKKNRQGHRDHTLILMLWRHGLRCGEAASIEWPDIDLDDGRIYIRRLKGSRSGEHPLNGDEIRALRRLQREQGTRGRWVWRSERGTPMSKAAIAKMVERLGDRVLPELKIHPHMFRHSCGYALAEKCIDTRRIQEWLGHKDIRHTAHYTALSGESLRGLWA